MRGRPAILRNKRCVLLTAIFATLASFSHAADTGAEENRFYQIVTIPIPAGITLEAGALQVMPNGQLAAASRIGDIYMIDGAFENPPTRVKFHQFASGLHEVLGLALREGWLYAVQRGEVTRMKDLDGDGRADLFETVSDDWGITGDYHEYAFGSKFDKDGNLWVTLTLTGSFTSEIEYRGWCLRITPEGKMIPTCSGLRSPGGIGTNCEGDMFFSENQGPWNGACALKHLKPGAFVGNPSGNRWYQLTDALGKRPEDPKSGSRMHIEAKKIPELLPPAVLFPYPKMGQSASGIVCDSTGGKFGPFAKQVFVGDQTHSTVMRVFLEKVSGRYQGACFPFKQGFASGSLALEFGLDSSLIVYGTDRGWGSRGGKPFALQRLIWNGQTPFEIHEMRAKPDGFELTFTQPVEADTASAPESYRLETYTYIYQSNYGSPEVDKTTPVIKSVKVSEDRRSARLIVDGLQEGHVHELHLPGVRSAAGQPLLHPAAYYTMNYIPLDETANRTRKKGSDMEGSWNCVSAIVDGRTLPEATVRQLRLTLTKDRYKTEKGTEVLFDSSYTVDQSKQPNQIDIVGTEGDLKGKAAQGIYSFADDLLKICYTMPGHPRPSTFESAPESAAYLIVWQRQKP